MFSLLKIKEGGRRGFSAGANSEGGGLEVFRNGVRYAVDNLC